VNYREKEKSVAENPIWKTNNYVNEPEPEIISGI